MTAVTAVIGHAPAMSGEAFADVPASLAARSGEVASWVAVAPYRIRRRGDRPAGRRIGRRVAHHPT